MFKKLDLNPDYFYTNLYQTGNDPLIIHLPQKDVLNRNEPYEMVYFINSFAKEYGWDKSRNQFFITACKKLETMIKTKLPLNIESKEKIKNWLINNWDKY